MCFPKERNWAARPPISPITPAHETAVKVSAYVCTQKGAMPVVPEELKG